MERTTTPPRYLPDGVAGGLMLAGHLGFLLWSFGAYAMRWVVAMPHTSLTLSEWLGASGALWWVNAFVSFAFYAWLSLGVAASRQWGFVGNLLLSAMRLLSVLGLFAAPTGHAPGAPNQWPTFLFNLPIFVYCGLRALAAFGPHSADWLALRGGSITAGDPPTGPKG